MGGVLARVRSFWNALRRPERLSEEMEEEMRFHIDMEAQRLAREHVLDAEEARRRAAIAFGGVEKRKAEGRDVRGTRFIDSTLQDLRYAIRRIRTQPRFAATIVLTLAVGIGATTAVFTLVEQVMLQPLPVVHPDRLWRIGDAVTCCHSNGYAQGDWSLFSREAYRRFRDHTPAFEKLAALQVGQAELAVRRMGSRAAARPLDGEYVSGDFFETFGISPWRGRLFTHADDREGAASVAVMSFHTWRDSYGSDPSVVGATYDLNGHPFTIIGIAPPRFFGVKTADHVPDLWLPLNTEPLLAGATSRLRSPNVGWLALIGRVRPGTDPKLLGAQLRLELRQWLASHTSEMTPQERLALPRQTLYVTPGAVGIPLMRERYQDALAVLMLAALCVLLVACANVGNLLLARGLRDRQQTALRAALGASRRRLVGRALVDSLVLGVLGGLAGIAVAYGGARLILHLAFGASHAWVPVDAVPSAPVLLFALGISLTSAMLFGAAPAWAASRADPNEALYGAHRSIGARQPHVQRLLVVAQVIVSLVLLSAAALLGQSLRNREHDDFGFDPTGRYLVSINSMLANHSQARMPSLVRAAEQRLRSIPGVRMASPVLYAPLSGYSWDHPIHTAGEAGPDSHEELRSKWTRVMPGFFKTVGDRILAGRPITDADDSNTRPVAVVNQAFARRFFGNQSPIGRRFGPGPQMNAHMYEIVGVAADVRFSPHLGEPVRPMYFVPEAQTTHFAQPNIESREVWSHYPYSIVIWAPSHPAGLQAQVKAALAAVDPGLLVYGMQPYTDVIEETFAESNMVAELTWLFGALALGLAAIGLYAMTAYGVEQRTREMGLRMALGADRKSVLATVLVGALSQVGIGLALGLPAAVGAGHLIAGQLFGVSPWDGATLFDVALLLVTTALAAASVPAMRAARVDPMAALRVE